MTYFKLQFKFEQNTTVEEAEAWVNEYIRPSLPPGAHVEILWQQRLLDVGELSEENVGEHIRIERGGHLRPILGVLKQVIAHPVEQQTTLVLEGGEAHLVSDYAIAHMNEGGEYEDSTISGD